MYKNDRLFNIINNPGNRFCFDCGSTYQTHCSINNGVILCSPCAEKHKVLRPIISSVRSLSDSDWTDEDLKFLEISGNKRFARLIDEFQIPSDKSFDFKYSTIAAYYYRKLLYSEIMGITPPIRPDISAGYKLMTDDMMKEPGIFGKIKQTFENIGDKLKQTFYGSHSTSTQQH